MIIIIIIVNILQVDLSDGEDGGEENAMGKKGKRDAKLLEKSVSNLLEKLMEDHFCWVFTRADHTANIQHKGEMAGED